MKNDTGNACHGEEQRPKHPYQIQPKKAFWRQTVSTVHPLDISEWYKKKFSLDGLQIAAGGSCFAQHIGRQLREKGFGYLDVEPAPSFLKTEDRPKFGYEMYSARYGNLYTVRQLKQLFDRAFGNFEPVEQYWEKDGGVVDPFRPTIEPRPFSSVSELNDSRTSHLARVREMFEQLDVFVFTLGLTEAWKNKEDGSIVPLAPGTHGGVYDPDKYELLNLDYNDNFQDLKGFFESLLKVRPAAKLLLTVSPVPLAATATDDNVVVAASYSKSVLRAAAGEFARQNPDVDYFPSYEIVSSHTNRAQFFEPDMRNVSLHGVKHVMGHFFSEHPPGLKIKKSRPDPAHEIDVICDENILAEFGAQL